jgi:hypothetical protein
MNSHKNISKYVNRTYSVLLIMLLSSFSTFAQNSSVDSTTIISVEAYKPFLSDAFKIKKNPTIKDTNKIIPNLKYSFLNKQVPVGFQINPIKPAKIKGEPLVKLYKGYAKVGIGTNVTPLAEFYFNSSRSKKYAYGIFGKHFSSKGISKIDDSGYSDNQIGVFGKRFTKKFTLYGKLSYDRNVFHYYGIPDDLTEQVISAEGIQKQQLNKYSASLALTRNFTDTTQFDYDFNLDYHSLNNLFSSSENNINLNGSLSKYHKKELYAADLEFNFNALKSPFSNVSSNNLLFGVRPHISTIYDKWKFTVGLGVFVNNDGGTKVHFYPEAEFKYNIVENIIIPYIGIKGGMIRNNLNTFLEDNPFVDPFYVDDKYSNQKYNVYAGIRGSISNKITFNTSFSKQKINDSPLYRKNFTTDVLQNKFWIIYSNLDLLKITGELAYQKLEKIKVILKGDYYSYTAQNEAEAWYKPNYKISLSGIYDLSDKILVRIDLFAIGKQYTEDTSTFGGLKIFNGMARELDGVFDANIGLEYRYTKKLSAFINFNNIGSVNYERYEDYPTQKFGVLGGLTYSF